ncbi:class I SAM-dependent methyltransferase [Domibacillus iocasae]|uniref:class I SAM-dependent methyltransferase n=1 Tax=Domibacillus iocasae TaxID=1714016 RepID=UPI000A7942D8|nr:class I SAM-dependent methyltransferase [Domibacillus iocasae]
MKKSYLDFLAAFGIGGAHPGGFSLTKEVFSGLDLPIGASILEVGCGTGQTAEYLAEAFTCNITAIDNHSIMLEKAAERLKYQNIDVKYGNAEQLDFSDQTFDFVLAESVISFTSSVDQTLSEMSRVLKKEGAMVAIEMTADNPLSKKQEKEVKELYGFSAILTEEEWVGKFKRAGFDSVNLLKKNNTLTEEILVEIHPSENIREELYDIWDAHHAFMNQPDNPLSYRVFYCRK